MNESAHNVCALTNEPTFVAGVREQMYKQMKYVRVSGVTTGVHKACRLEQLRRDASVSADSV
jgi:hypothetical protein